MKLSLSWVFEHIVGDIKKIDIPQLVSSFNSTIAEIEGWYKIDFDLSLFDLGQVAKINSDSILVKTESNQEISLPFRPDVILHQYYLIKKVDNSYVWARATDFGAQKDYFLPACEYDPLWKKKLLPHDYILEIDNKSLTHRPDLWGHRGVAREIAALLNFELKPFESLLSDQVSIKEINGLAAPFDSSWKLTIKNTQLSTRLGAVYIDKVENKPSNSLIMQRLCSIDFRTINAIIDITNYVMADLGYPMHAFDANAIATKQLVITQANKKEKLMLLDGQTIELTQEDMVISDGKKPISLAGIMGGAQTSVQEQTNAVVFEVGCFNATQVRRSSLNHKKRTEGSARFEKSLDMQQAGKVLAYAVSLMIAQKLCAEKHYEITVIGQKYTPKVVEVSHQFIESIIGMPIDSKFVVTTLEKLNFIVTQKNNSYVIEIPSFRASKDISMPYDIVEEIARFYGYNNIPSRLPMIRAEPKNLSYLYQKRFIKNLCVYALNLQEIQTYGFFDEQFLEKIDWQPNKTVEIENPVSLHWRRLATTLMPHIFKAVEQNAADHDRIQLFEIARQWAVNNTVQEQEVLVGIVYDKHKPIDFYDGKALVEQLGESLKISLEWRQMSEPEYPWYTPYRSAYVYHNNELIGKAGLVKTEFLKKLCPGNAFIFELDVQMLGKFVAPEPHYKPVSKYQPVTRDISLSVPLTVTAASVQNLIQQVDPRITHVTLVDYFQKEEWKDRKALTYRFVIQDNEKTLSSEEVDSVMHAVQQKVQKQGITIR